MLMSSAVDEVADAHLGRDGLTALVDAAVGGHVRMAIDDAGRDVFARDVNDDGSLRGGN